MESEIKGKAPKRKLKRVVQKKKKITDLNTSGSVMYYKKVKAALNVSLNSSRVSQTLKSNNKALAQSLQHVKQNLRSALNEIGHLKTENQELSIRLLSLKNQTSVAPDQARFEGLRAVFNSMSHYLLEMGTCINDGMDLCLTSTQQSSHTSTASHPQPMEECKVTDQPEEQDKSQTRPLLAAELNDDYSEADGPDDEWEGEMYAAGGNHEGLGKMTPDMSIIMEQSVLVDPEEGLAPPETCLSAVPEDARSVSDSKNGSKFKKISSYCKLPQRVRIGGSAKSSINKENAGSPEPGLKRRTSKTKFGSPQVKNKSAEHSDAAAAASLKSLPCHRRETFIVARNEEKSVDGAAEMSSTDSIENIADIPMPELVSASPLKDELAREVFEPDTTDHSEKSTQQAGQASTSNAKSTVEETSSRNKLSVDGTESVSVVTCRVKRKSAGKKALSTSTKQSKGSAGMANHSVSRPKKDTDFFISNPCALNLVHKKVTGSLEGCLDADKQPLEQPAPESTMDQFMAHIRESNRSSTNLASFLMVDDPNTSQKSSKSTENPAKVSKSRRSSGASFEPQSEDQTVYFDTDMELTQVLPQSVNLIGVAEGHVQGATKNNQREETKAHLRNRRKGEAALGVDQKTVSNKSKQKVKSGKEQTAEKDGEEVSGDNADSGLDKKLAVALRVNKPGQMVFAASRKEDDGSRKAIPAKLQTKARSKSKKQMEELAKNLPQKESECIFDFHDKTPRPSVADGKAGQRHASVFDLSLNDTVPGVGQSLASLRAKLKAMNENGFQSTTGSEKKEEAVSTNKGKAASSVLLGDVPVYSVPLKDDSSEPEPRPRSRGRSSSRSKDSGRQSRSRSRSGNGEKPQEETRRSARSRSRTHQKYTEDDAPEDEVASPTSSPKEKNIRRGRSRSRVKKDDDDDYKPSSRSQPRGRSRHRQTDEEPTGKEDEVASPTPSPKEKNIPRGRSRNRVKDDDDDDKKPSSRSQSRGRSLRRQTDEQPTGKEDEVASPTSSPKEKNIPRGRSRNRVKDDDDDGKKPSSRSQSRGRSLRQQTDEQPTGKEDEIASPTSSPKDKNVSRGRSRSRVKKDDEDNKTSSRSQPKGRNHHAQAEEQPTEDDMEQKKPLQRGRSKRRVFEDESNKKEEETPIISTLNSQDSAQESRSDSGRNRTKSRSNGLANQEDAEEKLLKGSEDSHQSDSTLGSPPQSSTSKHQSRDSDKRKVTREHSESEQDVTVSPSKKLCREKKSISNFEKVEVSFEMTENNKDSLPDKQKGYSKEDSTGLAVASPLLKKRKSSLPIAMPHAREEEGKTRDSPTLAKRKSKSHSKLTEKKEEKDKYLLDFEDLKHKLEEFDNKECSTVDSDSSAVPIMKSRPLVLPVGGATAAGNKNSSARSLPASDSEQTNRKATAGSKKGKSQPGSPKTNKPGPLVPRPRTSTASSAASPQRTDQRSSQGHFKDMDESSQDGKRAGRRAASSVCYKEPSLNAKLRRGDPHTSFLSKGQMKDIYKSSKTHLKHDTEGVARTVLHDLTNVDAE